MHVFSDTEVFWILLFQMVIFWMLKGVTEAEAGQLSIWLPTEHPVIAIWNNRIQNGCRIAEKVY